MMYMEDDSDVEVDNLANDSPAQIVDKAINGSYKVNFLNDSSHFYGVTGLC